jgi:hypothetical protein
MVDNVLSAQVIAAADGAGGRDVLIRNCTIAGNTLGLSTVMTLLGAADIQDSIIWQPGHTPLGVAHGTLTGSHVLTNDPPVLAPIIRVIDRNPRFVDPGNGDYHPGAASPAVDFAVAVPGNDIDLDGRPRDRDLINPDAHGLRDLGAYERQQVPLITLNPFFQRGLEGWPEVMPAVSSFDPTGGVGAGGGVSFNWVASDIILSRVTARAQCIHLPAPGSYNLTGIARTSGSLPPSNEQTALLHWEFRRDGDETCTSPPDSGGDFAITSGSSFVQRTLRPMLVVNENQWTPNSSVKVSIVMANTGFVVRNNLRGWFDNVEVFLDTDALFDDGFE